MDDRKMYVLQGTNQEALFVKLTTEQVDIIRWLIDNDCMSEDFSMDAIADILFETP